MIRTNDKKIITDLIRSSIETLPKGATVASIRADIQPALELFGYVGQNRINEKELVKLVKTVLSETKTNAPKPEKEKVADPIDTVDEKSDVEENVVVPDVEDVSPIEEANVSNAEDIEESPVDAAPVETAPINSIEEIYQKNIRKPTPFVENLSLTEADARTGASGTALEDREMFANARKITGGGQDPRGKEKYIEWLNSSVPEDVARSFAEQGLDISNWWDSMRNTATSRVDRVAYFLGNEGYEDYGRRKDRIIPETGERLSYQDLHDFSYLDYYVDYLKELNAPIKKPKGVFKKFQQKKYDEALKRQGVIKGRMSELEKVLRPLFERNNLSFDENTVKRMYDFIHKIRRPDENVLNAPAILSTGDIDFVKETLDSEKTIDEFVKKPTSAEQQQAQQKQPIQDVEDNRYNPTWNRPKPEQPITNAPIDDYEVDSENVMGGYGPPFDLSNIPEDTDYEAGKGSTNDSDANRAEIQAFMQRVLEQNPFVSDKYIKNLAKQNGYKVSTAWNYWGIPLRRAMWRSMGLGNYDPNNLKTRKIQQYADAAAYAKEIINMPNAELMQDRDTLEAVGLVGPLGESERAPDFKKRKREAKKGWKEAEEALKTAQKRASFDENITDDVIAERTRERDEAKERYERFNRGEDPDGKSGEEKADEIRQKAKEVLEVIEQLFDVATGKFKTDVKPDERTANFIHRVQSKHDAEVELYRDGETRAQRRSRERRQRESTGFDFLDQMFARGAKWTRKGQTLGGVLDSFSGGAGGGSGLFGSGLGKLLGSIGLVVGAITGLIGIGKKLYAAAQKSIQTTWELAQYNGRIGATKAQFEGHEFSRKQLFAAETEDERVELVSAWDDLLNESLELRIELAEVALYLQTKFLEALKGIVDWIGEVKGGVKDTKDAIEGTIESKEAQGRQRDQGEIINEGNLARHFFETGEIDETAWKKSSFKDMKKKDLEKFLSDKNNRAELEDAIAYNDRNRGYGFFEQYQGIEGGAPTDVSQLQQILSTIENMRMTGLFAAQSAAEQAKTSKAIEEAAKETARNTRKEKDPVYDAAIFQAMQKVAGTYAVKGGEKIAGDGYSHTWGAKQEKRYGRFASATQTNWGRNGAEEE